MNHFNTDIPELNGYDTGLCLSNLQELNRRQSGEEEAVIAVISELAVAICRDADGDSDTLHAILLSLQNDNAEEDTAETDTDKEPSVDTLRTGGYDPVMSHVSPINRRLLRRLGKHTGLCERLLLYRFMDEVLHGSDGTARSLRNGFPFSPDPMPDRDAPMVSPTACGRIAYLPGAFADKAYSHFSAHIPDCRAVPTAGFIDACEDVQNGLCEFGILPVENTANGKLTAFTRLILRCNLQIVAICDLRDGAASGQETRFALFRAACDRPEPLDIGHTSPKKGPLLLEILHRTDASSLSAFLTAAEFCGMSLIRADTLSVDETGTDEPGLPDPNRLFPVCCVLRADHADFRTFRHYLFLEAPDDTVIGLYRRIP